MEQASSGMLEAASVPDMLDPSSLQHAHGRPVLEAVDICLAGVRADSLLTLLQSPRVGLDVVGVDRRC